MSRYILSLFAFFYLSQTGWAQRVIAEFRTKNRQLNFQAIPFGDSILFSYDEIVTSQGRKVRDVKWVSNSGKVDKLFCPVNVFALESEGDNLYHYYWDKKSLRAYEMLVGSRTMNNLPESIAFKEEIILASYVDKNLMLMLLKEGGTEIAVQEIAGMRVVNTITYKLPITLEGLIKRNTAIEFYNAPVLDSFKGRARVKIFLSESDLYLVIDEKHLEATNSNPNVTHVLHLGKAAEVKYHQFKSPGTAEFGSFLFDSKLFQNHITKEKFSLLVYDLSGKQLMKHDLIADSLQVKKKESPKINVRLGSENFQGWEPFQNLFKKIWMSDPLIVVSRNDRGYGVQWGTYSEPEIGLAVGPTPLALLVTLFITTAIVQVTDGPGMSRYLYFETDLRTGKILPAELPPSESLRVKIDAYERNRQKKRISPFESKSYISFLDGVVAIYRLKPQERIGVTQLVYFE